MHALSGGVRPLVELSGKVFHREGAFVVGGREFRERVVDLWFRQDEFGGLLKLLRSESLKIVALDDAEGLQTVQLQAGFEVVEKGTGGGAEFRFLFDEETVHEAGLPGQAGKRLRLEPGPRKARPMAVGRVVSRRGERV